MEGANVIFSYTEEAVTAFLPKEIDHHGAKSIREAIDLKFFERLPKLLILDFSSTAFMDSSGIALIMGRCELAGERGARVRIKGLSPVIKKLVFLSGIEKIKNLAISET